MKLWGGRFEEGPSEVFEPFPGSLDFDRRLLEADIRGSQAFARALESVGIVTAGERAELVAAFDAILADAQKPEFYEGCNDEDVHTLVIRKLKDRVGALSEKIHTGRSRNEQVSLDVRLWLRGEIDRSGALLATLMQAFIDAARRDPAAVVPGYAHLRRAQPVLWAHYLLSYFEMFARDFERLHQARARVNAMPLGSGALAGSGFAFDREAIARGLGFASITRNSMDVSADRDFALDFLFAASTTMLHLSRLAEDWLSYSSEEFGWLELSDRVTSGSSLMPQKKDPDSLELMRRKCGRVFGDLTALFMTMKGLPMTYNRDMQEDKEPLFDAADQLCGSLEMARVVVDTAKLNAKHPAAAAEASGVIAPDLAEALARNGPPFHEARQSVGRLVLESVRGGKRPSDWNADSLVKFALECTAEMAKLLQPAEGMKTREIRGGTGPKAVAAALIEAQ